MRGLRLSQALRPGQRDVFSDPADELLDPRIHARSRFQSVGEPGRYAVYTVHDTEAWSPADGRPPGEHTLVVVREFRRVPLHASALALLLLTARAGSDPASWWRARHFVERAVSVYQPAYFCWPLAGDAAAERAHAGFTSARAAAAGSTAFSVDTRFRSSSRCWRRRGVVVLLSEPEAATVKVSCHRTRYDDVGVSANVAGQSRPAARSWPPCR